MIVDKLICGCIEYREDGRRHRTDGPAVYSAWCSYRKGPIKIYYLNGNQVSNFERWFEKLTYEEKISALYNPENFGEP